MKKLVNKIVRFIGFIYGHVTRFFIDLGGWFRSVWILTRKPVKVRMFFGFSHFWFAKRYANKRKRKSKSTRKSDMNQCVLPAGELRLLVLSQRELKRLQTKGYINNLAGYSRYFKKAYFNNIKFKN